MCVIKHILTGNEVTSVRLFPEGLWVTRRGTYFLRLKAEGNRPLFWSLFWSLNYVYISCQLWTDVFRTDRILWPSGVYGLPAPTSGCPVDSGVIWEPVPVITTRKIILIKKTSGTHQLESNSLDRITKISSSRTSAWRYVIMKTRLSVTGRRGDTVC